jgi:hypothetical protein
MTEGASTIAAEAHDRGRVVPLGLLLDLAGELGATVRVDQDDRGDGRRRAEPLPDQSQRLVDSSARLRAGPPAQTKRRPVPPVQNRTEIIVLTVLDVSFSGR